MIVIHGSIYPIISILVGILILIFPEILAFIIGVYLILIGILSLVSKSKRALAI